MRYFLSIFILIGLLFPVGSSTLTAQRPVLDSKKIELRWQANGYTFPGYRGRVLPVRGGTATVTATVTGMGATANLTFNWFVNNHFLEDESGKGKSTARIPINRVAGDAVVVKLTAVKARNDDRAEEEVRIPSAAPAVALTPGNSAHASRGEGTLVMPLTKGEARAQSYFLATSNPDTITFQWRIGDVVTEQTLPGSHILQLTTTDIPPDAEPIRQSLSVRIAEQTNATGASAQTILYRLPQ